MGTKVAVLGGGNGAHAVAADLTFAGHKVNMFEFPQFKANFARVLDSHGITSHGFDREGVAVDRCNQSVTVQTENNPT